MINNFALPHFPSLYSHSEEPEHVLTSDNRPWMSTQYFKFKLITSESISVITNTFLQAMSPNNERNNIRYEFMTATTRRMPYERRGDKEMAMVMKTDRVINLPYVDSFNFADGFDISHVSVSDLMDEKTAVMEARYIYTDRFDTYVEDTTRYRSTLDKLVDHRNIQVTYSLTGWEVTNISRDLMNNNTTRVVMQHYNWDGVRLASKMLNRSNSHQIINDFIAKIFELDKFYKFIYVNMYTGRRNKFNRKIYKRVKRKVYNIPSIPFDVFHDIFFKYSKNLNFVGVYTELFSKDSGMLDVIIEFNGQRI
ncbi:3250_t:CDS:1 [Gigaspora margarita]|uniref:3250_t:CDS:1 n=1 Tax=Gigaspora margarita TaxID=4874 RepID=A0ABM8W6E2_GIGMA|nr:3250_t:CDS:1 [Gigaspora margarita]